MKKTKLSLLVASLVTAGLVAVPVYAMANGRGTEPPSAAKSQVSAQQQLKVCQRHEKNINTILGHISSRTDKQDALFTTIANRVENYAVSKNKLPDNYQTLVANVNSQRAAADAAVASIKNTSFSCSVPEPKSVAAAIKSQLKQSIQTLKDYRTAVKNLIVGVKTVAAPSTSKTAGGQN